MRISKIYRKIFRIPINIKNRRLLKNSNFTIISSNCIGGVIYNELGLRFLSPTINMYFEAHDFIKFCKNLSYYINLNLIPCENTEYDYPVVSLGDIKLYCVHYRSFEEVNKSWKNRVSRINFNNLYIIMSERDGCTFSDILDFDKLPYKNKVIFVHKPMSNIKSSFCIENSSVKDDINHKVKSLTEYKSKLSVKRYIDDFDYVGFLNNNINGKYS